MVKSKEVFLPCFSYRPVTLPKRKKNRKTDVDIWFFSLVFFPSPPFLFSFQALIHFSLEQPGKHGSNMKGIVFIFASAHSHDLEVLIFAFSAIFSLST